MRNVLIGMLAALALPFLAFAEQWTDSRGVTWSYYVSDLFGDTSEYAVSHPGGVSISGASGAESVEGVLVFPDEIDGHEVVQIRLSLNCPNVTEVVWPARLKLTDLLSLRLSDDAVAFSFPSSLVALRGHFEGAHVQDLTFPNGLEVLDATFKFPDLTSVKLPDSLRVLKDKDDAFSMTGVKGTKVGTFTLIDGWAIGWDGSDAPDVVVPKECRGIASGLFSGHHENGTITFQEGFQYVSPHAFAQSNGKNGGWTEIVFPSTLKAIGHSAFYGTTRLTRLVIPAGDLGDYLFGSTKEYNYQRLTALELGEGVTSIGEGAFRNVQESPCYLPIVLPNSVTNIHTTSFGDRCCNDYLLQFKPGNTHFCRETANGITTVYRLENGVKVELISLETDWNCDQDEFRLPETVKSVQRYALQFGTRGNLGFIWLPKDVKYANGLLGWHQYASCPVAQASFDDGKIVWDYLYKDDGVMITRVRGAAGKVSVPDVIEGLPVVGMATGAVKDGGNVTALTFGANLRELSYSSVLDCTNLVSVTFKGDEPPESGWNDPFEGATESLVVYIREDAEAWDECLYTSYGEEGYFWQGYRVVRYKGPIVVPGEKAEIDTGLIGYTPKNLPNGLKYDAKTGKITGSATKPTGDDGVVVTFTKKGVETEELTFVVTALPKVTVAMEGDTTGCKVTGAGEYLVGKKVTLSATTPKGTAFIGWFRGGEAWPNATESAKAKLSYEMTAEDVLLVAKFEKEKMSVACAGLSYGSFVAGVAGAAGGIPVQIETQSGVKSVAVKFTPSCGLTYDAKKQLITGAPTKTGEVKAEITVTAVSGAVEKKTITLSVVALPDMAVGTFNGFVGKTANDEFTGHGTFTLTSTDAGKLTAKITDETGSYSFSAASWDSIAAGVCAVKLSTKKGEVLNLSLDTAAAWNAYQLTGSFIAGGKTYEVSAQRKAFGTPWYFTATGDAENGWTLGYAANAKEAALTVTMKADGTTSLAGTLGGNKISASGSVDVSGMTNGVLFADFVPVVSVKIGKTTAKKSMYIRTNLWFDRKADHESGVGSVKIVE